MEEVGLNFTRTGFLDVIQAMGATCEIDPLIKDSYEPTGRIFVKASPLKGVTVSKELTIRTIDELPLVALLATQAHGETKILDAGNLRFKESDRLKAVALELSRLGAHIEEEESGLVIQGPTPLKGAKVKSYHDHRMAMMLMLAGMISEGETQIDSIECISKSFPNFSSNTSVNISSLLTPNPHTKESPVTAILYLFWLFFFLYSTSLMPWLFCFTITLYSPEK